MTRMERFERSYQVAPQSGCWEWLRFRDRDGYGRFSEPGHTFMAHRIAYELLVGPIPPGMQIDHLCLNRACVNPGHLEAVTPNENWRRATSPTRVNALKSHCKHGHAFTPDNTYRRPDGTGRHCRKCQAAAEDRRRQRLSLNAPDRRI